MIKMQECVLCDGLLDDKYGHNAMPLAEGRCCSNCNEIFDIAKSGR